MSAPLFSIVTVTLNCADDAVRTAQSVLAQDFTDYEYIVKDGGSKDGTPERIKGLGNLNVIVASDIGIYDAMNQALELCTGQYVYFLNAGDTLHDARTLSRFAVQVDQQADIVYGNVYMPQTKKCTRYPRKLSRYYLFRKNLNHQAWMGRLGVYSALHGFDTQYHLNADQDFLWRALWCSHVCAQHVDVILADFMYGGASTRRSARAEVGAERWLLVKRYYSSWEIALFGIAGLYFLNPFKARIWDLRYGARVLGG